VRRHRAALITILTAAVLDLLCAWAFSVAEHITFVLACYWAVTTATTVGYGDVLPRTGAGHVIAVITMLTCIPLFAATFSLFTSGLTSAHVENSESRIAGHVSAARDHMREALEERMTVLHEKVTELQSAYGNGGIADLHARLDTITQALIPKEEDHGSELGRSENQAG
jgi:hypothetical protein